MNAIKRNRLLLVLAAVLVLGSGSVVAQTGRLELNVPNFDLFTPTDWIDAATFTLKETIPAGISGAVVSTDQNAKWFLWGRVTKQATGDASPKTLATFWINNSTPIYTKDARGGGEFAYELSVGALARGSSFNITYREETAEIEKLKDQLNTGIASLTGKFTLDIRLMRDNAPNIDGTGAVASLVRVFDIPFSTATQAKIIVQVDPVVTVPNPTFTVQLPAERPQMEYELAVYRVEDNPRDAVRNGRPVWRERVNDGRTILFYPQTATPLVEGARYVVAGKSYIQSSANRDKVTVDADLVVFRYGQPTGNTSGGGNANTGGQDASRPDPLVVIFGNAATQISPQLAAQLTAVIRRLEERGWTFTEFRYNNRPVTPAEVLQLLEQFASATVTVVE
jgi:hypothetical protein